MMKLYCMKMEIAKSEKIKTAGIYSAREQAKENMMN